ncbi:MAG: aminotransferase class I/II-fold pyridoxal phosphate-dependent enzyme [Clostridia bacterium]|nr:aminotransferase class I/II-fold pyridoxal phosphate-dependent enzyme [Clostridia bacterium]
MKYDFTSILNRVGKDALAVDALGQGWAPGKPCEGFDPIPMWVADMNFPTAPAVTRAMTERINHPCFGYFDPREEYFDAIIGWQTARNGVVGLERKHIGYENGVLGGILSALGTFCSKGDNVLLNSPVYMGFMGSLTNAGYRIVESPLVLDENNIWRLDLADMEQKIVENRIHAALFCSPHNPTGRVWERWEIEAVMELYRKHDVYVVSDEIWSDIILAGNKHIPTQSVSEYARMRTVAQYATTKTFSLAGLVGSYHIIYNDRIRDRVEKESSLSHYNNMNVLSMYALIGGYSDEGAAWVDELCAVLTENIDYAMDYINTHFKGVKAAHPQGTYMIFLDCKEWMEAHGKTLPELVKMGHDVGVAWQDGTGHGGTTHIRLNVALPLARVKEAFGRMDAYVFNGRIKHE